MPVIRRALAAAACTFWFSAAVFGQPKPPPVRSFENPYGRSLQWLANSQVQQELQLTDEQRDKMRQAQDEMTRRVREMYKSHDVNEKDFRKRQQAYREKIESLSDEAERKVEAILSPSQAVRLKQIIRQKQLSWSSDGILAVLLEKDVSTDLCLTDQQRDLLREKQTELHRERVQKVQQLYRQLQEEARKRMFAVLSTDQRHQLEAMLGPKFDAGSGIRMPPPLDADPN